MAEKNEFLAELLLSTTDGRRPQVPRQTVPDEWRCNSKNPSAEQSSCSGNEHITTPSRATWDVRHWGTDVLEVCRTSANIYADFYTAGFYIKQSGYARSCWRWTGRRAFTVLFVCMQSVQKSSWSASRLAANHRSASSCDVTAAAAAAEIDINDDRLLHNCCWDRLERTTSSDQFIIDVVCQI